MQWILDTEIDLEKTIIFFDEIQLSEKLISNLKYFCEAEKPFKIICAGSLLGVKINRFHSSFPVGKVKMEYMYPMDFEEYFKLYLSDVGLLTSLLEIQYNDILLNNSFLYKENIAENYVAAQLVKNGLRLYYWKSNSDAEIDFILYNEDGLIPIEVKASDNITSRSLNSYMKQFNPKYSIRISSKKSNRKNFILPRL